MSRPPTTPRGTPGKILFVFALLACLVAASAITIDLRKKAQNHSLVSHSRIVVLILSALAVAAVTYTTVRDAVEERYTERLRAETALLSTWISRARFPCSDSMISNG